MSLKTALQDFQAALNREGKKSETVSRLVSLLNDEDTEGLRRELDKYKGSYAVEYIVQALLKPGHGQTLQGTLKLLQKLRY